MVIDFTIFKRITNKFQDSFKFILGLSKSYKSIFRLPKEIIEIFRIFKLARHITGLQTLGMTLKNR